MKKQVTSDRQIFNFAGVVGGTLIAHFILSACATPKAEVVSVQPVPKKICFNFKPGFGFYIGTERRKDPSDRELAFNGKHYFVGARPIIATSNIISVTEDAETAALPASAQAPAEPKVGPASSQVFAFKLMEPARAQLSGATYQHRGDALIVKGAERVYSASTILTQIDQDSFQWRPQTADDHILDEICER